MMISISTVAMMIRLPCWRATSPGAFSRMVLQPPSNTARLAAARRRHRVLGRDIVLRFALGGGALHRTLYRRGQGGAIGRFVLSPGAGFGVTLSGPGCVPGRGRATLAAATPSRRLQPLP